ncbi:hypothetical protein SUT328_11360 [Streptococcus parasuis]|nr:hypothetical protein SUT380_11270 [Streptococcus parasuis]GIC30625.1 hypothetical protein SUT328_11360 [Streptococcus parasuis]
MKSCRVDRIEQSIKEKLGQEVVKPRQFASKTRLLREIERLKKQKLSCYQDCKDNLVTRKEYITKKMDIDESVNNLEQQLNEANKVQLLTKDQLTKEIISTHIEKVVVDCLGFFTVIYR